MIKPEHLDFLEKRAILLDKSTLTNYSSSNDKQFVLIMLTHDEIDQKLIAVNTKILIPDSRFDLETGIKYFKKAYLIVKSALLNEFPELKTKVVNQMIN